MKNFIKGVLAGLMILSSGFSCKSQNDGEEMRNNRTTNPSNLKIFLCGDVMIGRGIDQAMPVSVDPEIYESYVKDARGYLRLAERANGNIPTPLSYDYLWGDALKVWEVNDPDFKLINLETSITTHSEPWPGKGINYRMHPENTKILTAGNIDHCSLANNHTLDWGRPGLLETMETLDAAGIKHSGAGKDETAATSPSVLKTKSGRILIFSYGTPGSGIPEMWAAETNLYGINFLPDLTQKELNEIKNNVLSHKEPGDIVVFSVHWGGNWGYDVPERHREFAHKLIDDSVVDVVFGHSSHHPMGIEVYKEKLILYGAGDFLNDYEGISGHREFRPELTLMYFPEFDPESAKLQELKMVPMKIENFRLNFAGEEEARWLKEMLDREGEELGTKVHRQDDNSLWLKW